MCTEIDSDSVVVRKTDSMYQCNYNVCHLCAMNICISDFIRKNSFLCVLSSVNYNTFSWAV